MNKDIIAKTHEIFHAKTGIDISISIDKALREILQQQRQEIITEDREDG